MLLYPGEAALLAKADKIPDHRRRGKDV